MKTRRGELRSPAVPQKPLLINILFITGEHSSPLRPRWSEARKQQFTSISFIINTRSLFFKGGAPKVEIYLHFPMTKRRPQFINRRLFDPADV